MEEETATNCVPNENGENAVGSDMTADARLHAEMCSKTCDESIGATSMSKEDPNSKDTRHGDVGVGEGSGTNNDIGESNKDKFSGDGDGDGDDDGDGESDGDGDGDGYGDANGDAHGDAHGDDDGDGYGDDDGDGDGDGHGDGDGESDGDGDGFGIFKNVGFVPMTLDERGDVSSNPGPCCLVLEPRVKRLEQAMTFVANKLSAKPSTPREPVTASNFERYIDEAVGSGHSLGVSRALIRKFLESKYGIEPTRYTKARINRILKRKVELKQMKFANDLFSLVQKR